MYEMPTIRPSGFPETGASRERAVSSRRKSALTCYIEEPAEFNLLANLTRNRIVPSKNSVRHYPFWSKLLAQGKRITLIHRRWPVKDALVDIADFRGSISLTKHCSALPFGSLRLI